MVIKSGYFIEKYRQLLVCLKQHNTRASARYGLPRAISRDRPYGARRLRQTQDLARLDLVGIGQLVLVQLEDLHIRAGAAKMLLGNGAQGVTGLDRIRFRRRGGGAGAVDRAAAPPVT